MANKRTASHTSPAIFKADRSRPLHIQYLQPSATIKARIRGISASVQLVPHRGWQCSSDMTRKTATATAKGVDNFVTVTTNVPVELLLDRGRNDSAIDPCVAQLVERSVRRCIRSIQEDGIHPRAALKNVASFLVAELSVDQVRGEHIHHCMVCKCTPVCCPAHPSMRGCIKEAAVHVFPPNRPHSQCMPHDRSSRPCGSATQPIQTARYCACCSTPSAKRSSTHTPSSASSPAAAAPRPRGPPPYSASTSSTRSQQSRSSHSQQRTTSSRSRRAASGRPASASTSLGPTRSAATPLPSRPPPPSSQPSASALARATSSRACRTGWLAKRPPCSGSQSARRLPPTNWTEHLRHGHYPAHAACKTTRSGISTPESGNQLAQCAAK